MSKKRPDKRKSRKHVFVALPSKLLRDGEGPVDEYRQFVRQLREIGCAVTCPLEDVNWSHRKPKRPALTMKERLKDIETADHLVALPVVAGQCSPGVMGYTFYAAAKGIPTSVYLRGSNDLDVPWQLVGLRHVRSEFSIHFYQSNLLSGFADLANSIVERSVEEPNMTDYTQDDAGCPFGDEYLDYWRHRRQLFSKWDQGIQCDEVGLSSIKPECIAAEIASQLNGDCVLDAFTGLGGSAIAFALQGKKVIAFDTCELRLNMARHNASVYGVADQIQFVCGDVFQGWKQVRDRVNAVYLDPSWGGPLYSRLRTFRFQDFETDEKGDVRTLLADAYNDEKHICISLPKNFDTRELTDLHGGLVAIEDGDGRDESGIRLSWHTRGTKVLFMTAFF